MAIRKDTHLECLVVDQGGDVDGQVFDVKYPLGREMR